MKHNAPGLMLITQLDVVGAVPVRRTPEPDMQSGGSACGEHGTTVKKAGMHGITQIRDSDMFTCAYLSCCTRRVSSRALARVNQIKRTDAMQDES